MYALRQTLNMVARQSPAQLMFRSAFQANFATSSMVGDVIALKFGNRSKFTLRSICSTRCQLIHIDKFSCILKENETMDKEQCCKVVNGHSNVTRYKLRIV